MINSEKWALYDNQPAFVLGFHGCDASIGEQILSGEIKHLNPSENNYDWLGNGIYFWESNPKRAYEFAIEACNNTKLSRGKIVEPFVIGAVINLGASLNLINSKSLNEVQETYGLLQSFFSVATEDVMPKNSANLLRRELDCAVIEALHVYRENQNLQSYESVRGVFWEGNDLYPHAGFKEKNHIQLCVRDTSCILGYFRPIELD